MTLPFGIDVSSYQANKERNRLMDWLKARTEGVKYAFVKATEGSSWIDPTFAYNWAELRRLQIPHGAYHYFRPKEDALLQAQEFVDIVDPEAGELMVLDVENSGGLDRVTLTKCVIVALETIYGMTGRYPLIYSRAGWLNEHIDMSRMPKLDYWLAQYKYAMPYPLFTSEYPSDKMTIPNGIDRSQIKFHQTSERGNGKLYGAQSYYIDTDRFLGADLASYFNAETHNVYLPIVTTPAPVVDKPLYQARVTTSPGYNLLVRDAPNGAKVGVRESGAIVDVYEERAI